MVSMVLSPRTVALLKNYSQINPSLIFRPGGKLATYSIGHAIFSNARIEEDFPFPFGIYDLNKFLSVLSLFEEPSLDFQEHYVVISSGKKKVNFLYCDITLIQGREKIDAYAVTGAKLVPTVDMKLELSQVDFADIKKAISVLRLPEIAFIGDGNTIAIEVLDSKNPTGDSYAIEVGESEDKFSFVFRDENMKLIPGDYKVEVCWGSRKIARFLGNDVEYFIALQEKPSSFEVSKTTHSHKEPLLIGDYE